MPGLLDFLRPRAQTPGSGAFGGAFRDPSVLLPIAAQLLGNQGNAANFGNAFAAAGPALQERKQKNATLEILRSRAPELAEMIDAGMPIDEAWNLYGKQRFAKGQGYINAGGGNLFNADTGEWVSAPGGGAEGVAGLVPVWLRDENGNPVIGQATKDGKIIRSEMPDGLSPVGPYEKSFETSRGDKAGEAAGAAQAAAPGDMQAAQNALELVDSIRDDPNRQRGTGFSSVFNGIPGTAGYDFSNKVDQAKSGAFLTAIQQMRGLGSLSNAEGSTATAAVTRMNTATSEEEFLAALDAYEKIVRQGYARAAARLQGSTGAPGPAVDLKTKYGLD